MESNADEFIPQTTEPYENMAANTIDKTLDILRTHYNETLKIYQERCDSHERLRERIDALDTDISRNKTIVTRIFLPRKIKYFLSASKE